MVVVVVVVVRLVMQIVESGYEFQVNIVLERRDDVSRVWVVMEALAFYEECEHVWEQQQEQELDRRFHCGLVMDVVLALAALAVRPPRCCCVRNCSVLLLVPQELALERPLWQQQRLQVLEFDDDVLEASLVLGQGLNLHGGREDVVKEDLVVTYAMVVREVPS